MRPVLVAVAASLLAASLAWADGAAGPTRILPLDVSIPGSIDATVAADSNNWSPANLEKASVVRVTVTGTARRVTGLDASSATHGRAIVLRNVGPTFDLILEDASTSSSAANRFECPGAGNYYLPAGGGQVLLVYDTTIASGGRWVVQPAAVGVTVNATLVAAMVSRFEFPSGFWSLNTATPGVVSVEPSAAIAVLGTQVVGANSNGLDFAATTYFKDRVVKMGDATRVELPASSSCAPVALGAVCYDTDTRRVAIGDGTVPRYVPLESTFARVGGTGADGALQFDGSCSAGGLGGDCCRGGSISGSSPSKVCTFTANTLEGTFAKYGSQSLSMHAANWSSVSITGGTVTIAASSWGAAGFDWKSTGAVTISGGVVDLTGKGGAGATSGTCANSNAGKSGGNNDVLIGGVAGTTTPTAGTAGAAAYTDAAWFQRDALVIPAGTGGGACPASGQTAAASAALGSLFRIYGGTGGGGGGCAGSCSGTCGAGGRGGGALRLESATSITISGSASIRVDGADGATGGGGGGGGGGVALYAPTISNGATTDTGTCTAGTPRICVGGGAAGGSPPTNCGAGAAGGDGVVVAVTVPS